MPPFALLPVIDVALWAPGFRRPHHRPRPRQRQEQHHHHWAGAGGHETQAGRRARTHATAVAIQHARARRLPPRLPEIRPRHTRLAPVPVPTRARALNYSGRPGPSAPGLHVHGPRAGPDDRPTHCQIQVGGRPMCPVSTRAGAALLHSCCFASSVRRRPVRSRVAGWLPLCLARRGRGRPVQSCQPESFGVLSQELACRRDAAVSLVVHHPSVLRVAP